MGVSAPLAASAKQALIRALRLRARQGSFRPRPWAFASGAAARAGAASPSLPNSGRSSVAGSQRRRPGDAVRGVLPLSGAGHGSLGW